MEPVLSLGYLDPPKKLYDNSLSDDDQKKLTLSRFGGYIGLPYDVDNRCPLLNIACSQCGGSMLLVSQLWTTYCDSGFNRILYLFCCSSAITHNENDFTKNELQIVNKKPDDMNDRICTSLANHKSWRIIRLIFSEERYITTVENTNLTITKLKNTIKLDQANDNYMTAEPSIEQSIVSPVLSDWLNDYLNVSINNISQTPAKNHTADVSHLTYNPNKVILYKQQDVLPAIEIYFESSETVSQYRHPLDIRAKQLELDYNRRCENGEIDKEDALDLESFTNLDKNTKKQLNKPEKHIQDKKCWDSEGYEKKSEQQKHFEKFQNEITKYPNHVIRYVFGGTPIWPTLPTNFNILNEAIPSCQFCGSKRVFECQLMPSLIGLLQFNISSQQNMVLSQFLIHSDWSSIAIYSCSQDCCSTSNATNEYYMEEYIIVCPAI